MTDEIEEACQQLRESDDLVRRADLIINDLLLLLPADTETAEDIEQWITDSREAINRSLE